MLSLGATLAIGMDVLAHHWTIQEDVAAQHGQVADRDKWRLVGLMHLAETEEQARQDVEYGITQWFRYFQNVAAFPQMAVEGGDIDEMVDFVNGGLGVIGTPDQAIAQIEELLEQSNGGFGAYLTLSHNWANNQATKKSYELFARHVMPRFQGSVGQPHRRSRTGTAGPPRTRREAVGCSRRGHAAIRSGGGEQLTRPTPRSHPKVGSAVHVDDRSRRRLRTWRGEEQHHASHLVGGGGAAHRTL